ncbi:MAG: hypothetical protein GY754_13995 [bacterium]|nr:hypothetical protein [bacterium]
MKKKKKKYADNHHDEPVFQHEFFDTTTVSDFVLKKTGKAPEGYPLKHKADSYTPISFTETYEKRRQAFIDHCLKNPAGSNIKGYYYELLRMHENIGPVHAGMIQGALHYINERYDCADFVLLGIMRMLYQLTESPLLTGDLKQEAEQTILAFKYWPDEPGIDSMCYWTENHQIMFSCNEYLAGQLMPEAVFVNSGMTGYEKMEKARPRIQQWLDLRFKTGFSEWLSNIYYDEDITALLNLVDFCNDEVLSRRAAIVLDCIFLDMALNSFHGAFQSTHGRCYTREKQNAFLESTIDTQKLLFGMGKYSGTDNMSAVALALSSKYRLPKAIYEIAVDSKRDEIINRQRMGIRLEEAECWGLNPRDPADAMVLLSLEAYAHPRTFGPVLKLFDSFRWWENQFFSDFKANKALINVMRKTGLTGVLARLLEKDLTRNTREEVNIYTYKTPDYILSSAQDYRKGYGGDQQHIWQASFGPETVCFTTHPGHKEDSSAGYWIGSGTLPRVAQVKNLLIAVYRVSRMPGLYMSNKLFFTHAWFPKDSFDETVERDGWVFGRKGKGYIALYSQKGYRWQNEGDNKEREIIAPGRKNIWVCELGRETEYRTFERFIENIAGASLACKGQHLSYESPSQGRIEFGWSGALKQNGKIINLDEYPRYDNPYCTAEFPPREIVVKSAHHSLRLNCAKGIRDSE